MGLRGSCLPLSSEAGRGFQNELRFGVPNKGGPWGEGGRTDHSSHKNQRAEKFKHFNYITFKTKYIKLF